MGSRPDKGPCWVGLWGQASSGWGGAYSVHTHTHTPLGIPRPLLRSQQPHHHTDTHTDTDTHTLVWESPSIAEMVAVPPSGA